jgi:hypothetical protein
MKMSRNEYRKREREKEKEWKRRKVGIVCKEELKIISIFTQMSFHFGNRFFANTEGYTNKQTNKRTNQFHPSNEIKKMK